MTQNVTTCFDCTIISRKTQHSQDFHHVFSFLHLVLIMFIILDVKTHFDCITRLKNSTLPRFQSFKQRTICKFSKRDNYIEIFISLHFSFIKLFVNIEENVLTNVCNAKVVMAIANRKLQSARPRFDRSIYDDFVKILTADFNLLKEE